MDKYQNYPVCLGSDFGTKQSLNYIRSESEHFNADLVQENTSNSSFEYIDVYKAFQGTQKGMVTEHDLMEWLTRDPSPRFRHIVLQQQRYKWPSIWPLEISKEMLKTLLGYYRVMPDILELLASFGDSGTSYTIPGDFRVKVFGLERQPSKLSRPVSPDTNVPSIQMCYTLQSVQDNKRNTRNRYSIRQILAHHQYEPSTDTAFWLTVHTNPQNQDCIEHLYPDSERRSDDGARSWTACLETHLALCEWAMEGWGWYIISLEIEYDRFANESFVEPNDRFEISESQQNALFGLQEQTKTLVSGLEGNTDVLSSLLAFYERKDVVQIPVLFHSQNGRKFSGNLRNLTEIANRHLTRARRLKSLIAGLKQEISLRRNEILLSRTAVSAEITQLINENSLRVTYLSQYLVRSVVILILLFLPGIFASTFFSTDVVHFMPGETIFSLTALSRWLVVTLPLTFITLLLFWFGLKLPTVSFWRRTRVRDVSDDVEKPTVTSVMGGLGPIE